MRIGGYVRYDVGLGHVGLFDHARTSDVRTGEDQGTSQKNTRFTLKTWTGQETELGTLKTYTETRVNFGNRDTSVSDSSRSYAFNGGITLTSAWSSLVACELVRTGRPSATSMQTWFGITLTRVMAFRLWFHSKKARA